MANPTSRATLKNYCLQRLGEPTIKINVDDAQLEDRIDESIQFFQTYHDDSFHRTYIMHQVTANDISNTYISIANNVVGINKIMPIQSSSALNLNFFDYQWQLQKDVFQQSTNFLDSGVTQYYMLENYLAELDLMFNRYPTFDYSRHENKIYMWIDWTNDISVGDYIAVDAYITIDPQVTTSIYNDYFLKKYTTALFKLQWGNNLSKYNDVQLLGGISFNGAAIKQEAMDELEKLETEARLNWELPVLFEEG